MFPTVGPIPPVLWSGCCAAPEAKIPTDPYQHIWSRAPAGHQTRHSFEESEANQCTQRTLEDYTWTFYWLWGRNCQPQAVQLFWQLLNRHHARIRIVLQVGQFPLIIRGCSIAIQGRMHAALLEEGRWRLQVPQNTSNENPSCPKWPQGQDLHIWMNEFFLGVAVKDAQND